MNNTSTKHQQPFNPIMTFNLNASETIDLKICKMYEDNDGELTIWVFRRDVSEHSSQYMRRISSLITVRLLWGSFLITVCLRSSHLQRLFIYFLW